MLFNNSRGSEWRKCDLHIHSTASDGTATPQQLVDEAVKQGFEIIALTDHHTVDNIDEIKAYGKEQGITVISGIEFRTEYGQKSVHMIGLFPDSYSDTELNQTALYELILCPLNLTKTEIKLAGRSEHPEYDEEKAFKEGLLRVQVDFKTAADLIHKYGGIVTVHAGGKANSFDEEMKHEGSSKKNVSIADSLGPVKEELLRHYIDICEVRNISEVGFYLNGWDKPCIAASDAHSISQFARNYCWIKCEPSFEGIKQIIYEPESRVRIQKDKPEEKSDYLVIDRICLNHEDFGEQIIPFNQGLNTIIGGRSSGKSILLGCLARLCGDTKPIKENKPQYDEYIQKISESMRICWRDLGEDSERKIDFFPQSYIIDMASDPNKVRELIENIIRDENGQNKDLSLLKEKLESIKVKIHSAFSEYRNKISELILLEEDVKTIGNRDGILQEISKIEAKINHIRSAINDGLSDAEEEYYNNQKAEIYELKRKVQEYRDSLNAIETLIGVPIFTEIESYMNSVQNEETRTNISKAYSELKKETQEKWKFILNKLISELKNQIEKAENRISQIENDKSYIRAIKFYEENTRLSEENLRLEKENDKISKINSSTDRIKAIRSELNGIIDEILSCYDELFSLQIEYCTAHIVNKEDIVISPKVTFQASLFQNEINKYFHGRNNKNDELNKFSYSNHEGFKEFIAKALIKILNNEFAFKNRENNINIAENILTSNPYLIDYNISYQGDDLDDMSEGKVAFVILRLLLDFSTNEYPILIDQPEDDLDNRAIYNDLVKYLREKKVKRQIIIASHNPNIAVGADAEEIIVANQQGIGNTNPDNVKFAYITGALEDSFVAESEYVLLKQGIREHVCEILEGGEKAFQLREHKYQLSK